MQQRMADRQNEADQQRLADLASRGRPARQPRNPTARPKTFLRYLFSLI
jgi:hypothetical protein